MKGGTLQGMRWWWLLKWCTEDTYPSRNAVVVVEVVHQGHLSFKE